MADGTLRLDTGSRRWALATAAACLLPLLLQLPPPVAVALGVAAVGVAWLSWRQPLPGVVRLVLALAVIGVVLATAGFRFGRDTGCALLAAMIAIKPAETFTLRDARSLVGFGLFAPFATFLLDQGPASLVLGLVATVLALAALQRLAELESGDPVPTRLSWRSFAGVARLLAIGLPLALAVFWLFPRLASPVWGVPDRAMARPGLSDRMSPDDWPELLNDETVTVRARFFGATPSTSEMYWRGPVLWHFDGVTWTQPRWLRGAPAAPVQPEASARWDYEVELEPTDRAQLVALDLPLSAPEGTALSIDHGLYAPRPLGILTRWRMQSAPPASYQPQLPALLRQMALQLPTGYNPRTLALARRWRAEAGVDDAAIVRRALAWIRAEFAYTLAPQRTGRDSIDDFLFRTQAGYCEHFSSSFVVLMRAAGVPARVVTGYAGGYRNPIGDYWLVRRSDAHAWAEVWLPGRGWMRVDPTAAVAPERIYDTLADRAPGAQGLLGDIAVTTPLLNVGDWLRRGWNDFVLGFDASRQEHMLQWLGIERLTPARLGLLFALAACLALLWMLWLSTRAPREADPVMRAWRRLETRYRRLGLAREAHETALHWAERVGKARPDAADGLQKLTRRFSDWRYAPGQPGGAARELIRDLHAHRPPRR